MHSTKSAPSAIHGVASIIEKNSCTNDPVKNNRYSVWGETRDPATLPTDLGYTGQETVSNFSILYYNARWYDPTLGRFLQPDSIIPEPYNPVSYDRYTYVYNNPVNSNDPSGHCPFCFIGAAVGGLIGALGYFANNFKTFDTGEYWTAVGAGVTAGALVGSGVGIMAAPTATAALTTTATVMIGAGSSATISEWDYLVSNSDSFETKAFIETTAISAAVGGVSAALPITRAGVAVKGLTYIAGAETQYALQTDNWTVQGAQEAAIYGTIGAGLDIAVNYGLSTKFITNTYMSKITPVYKDGYRNPDLNVLSSAASFRGQEGLINTASGLISGSASSITIIQVRKWNEMGKE